MAKYKSNPKALEAILRSAPVQSLVHEHGDRLAAAAGEGYGASYMQGKSRYRGLVGSRTSAAYRDQLKNNTLLRVLG